MPVKYSSPSSSKNDDDSNNNSKSEDGIKRRTNNRTTNKMSISPKHRLFAQPTGSRKRKATSSPSAMMDEDLPAESTSNTSKAPSSDEEVPVKESSPSPVVVDEQDAYACYQDSVAHIVLKRLKSIDPTVELADNPYPGWEKPWNLPELIHTETSKETPAGSADVASAKSNKDDMKGDDSQKKDDDNNSSKNGKKSASTPLQLSAQTTVVKELPEIVRRSDVLPQNRRLRVGDFATVRQRDMEVGSGFIVDQVGYSIFVVESLDGRSVWTVRSSQLFRTVPPAKSQPAKATAPLNMNRKKVPKKRIKATFMAALTDELRTEREIQQRIPNLVKLPNVNFFASARAIAQDSFKRKDSKPKDEDRQQRQSSTTQQSSHPSKKARTSA